MAWWRGASCSESGSGERVRWLQRGRGCSIRDSLGEFHAKMLSHNRVRRRFVVALSQRVDPTGGSRLEKPAIDGFLEPAP